MEAKIWTAPTFALLQNKLSSYHSLNV